MCNVTILYTLYIILYLVIHVYIYTYTCTPCMITKNVWGRVTKDLICHVYIARHHSLYPIYNIVTCNICIYIRIYVHPIYIFHIYMYTLYVYSICALYTDGIGRVAMGRGRVGAVIKSQVSRGRATATMTSSLILTWVIYTALWRMYKALLRISRILLRIHRALTRTHKATITMTDLYVSHLYGSLADV